MALEGTRSEPASASIPLVPVVLAALAAAVLLGREVVRQPDLLHFSASLETLAALAGAAVLSVVLLRVPAAGLALLVAFVFLNLSQVLVRFHHLPSLLEMLAVPLVLSVSGLRTPADLRRLVRHPVGRLVLLYALVVLVSTTLARDLPLADARLVEILKCTVIYALVVGLVASARLLRVGVWALVASGGLLAALALAQVATGRFDLDFGGLARIKNAQIWGTLFEPRIAGPLGDPNFFAQILVAVVPVALFLAWGSRTRAARAAAFTCTALLVGAIVFTYSRGAALALGLVLVLALLLHGVDARRAALGATVGLMLVALVPRDFTRRLTTFGELLPGDAEVLHPDSSFVKRRLLTAVAWRIFLDHPLLGVGAANYTTHFDAYAEEVGSVARDYEDTDDRHYPHNLLLELGSETGLVGVASFAALVAAAFASLRRSRTRLVTAGRRLEAGLASGIGVGLVGFLVTGAFLHDAFPRYPWLLFALAAALDDLAARLARAPEDAA